MKAGPLAAASISELSLTILNTKCTAGVLQAGGVLASQLQMYRSNFAVNYGIKMCLVCCMLKAGREYPERTVLHDTSVLFFCLKSGRVKILHTAATLKPLQLEKK